MITQKEFSLRPQGRGYHLVTEEVRRQLPDLPQSGILHLFVKHTSAGLTLNENADPTVRMDFESFMNVLIPENHPVYEHTLEGPDDMPAHLKSTLIGQAIIIPITNSRLNLGTWQGIYLCEFRNHVSSRSLVATIISCWCITYLHTVNFDNFEDRNEEKIISQ